MSYNFIYNLPLLVLAAVVLIACIGFSLLVIKVIRLMGWVLAPDEIATATVLHGSISVLNAFTLGLIVVGVQSQYR
ncbi:hypothetical protein LBMAG49_01980 [Planctomycetota bacterium]|nr:hypothetical protein LBMAG49_01980 [Planctomycetota bacterium]